MPYYLSQILLTVCIVQKEIKHLIAYFKSFRIVYRDDLQRTQLVTNIPLVLLYCLLYAYNNEGHLILWFIFTSSPAHTMSRRNMSNTYSHLVIID